jgi:fumarylacetoacetase
MLEANDPKLTSWLPIPQGSDFPIQNLPFGVFKTRYLTAVGGVALGSHIVDLVYLHEHGFFEGLGLPPGVFNQPQLNDFFSLGRPAIRAVRNRVSQLMRVENNELNAASREIALVPMAEAQLMLPVIIPDYTDFYSSMEHATNVGSMFRDPQNALLPNWKHLPVGYHGRASSIVVSGTSLHRPKGQIKPAESALPVFCPTQKLDFELEVAFISCRNSELGKPILLRDTEESIAGLTLFNDWSARDIQQWEYVPLGPFLGKNFASTLSPWVVTLDALEPFRVSGPEQLPHVLPYLAFEGDRNFDIRLDVLLETPDGAVHEISRSNYKYLYWNMAQQLAHHTINGCNIRVGDVFASGTISGPSPGSYGSLLELTWNGQRPLHLSNGETRTFLHDGDTIHLRAWGERAGVRIGFGACSGKILPAY